MPGVGVVYAVAQFISVDAQLLVTEDLPLFKFVLLIANTRSSF
jgi:hypothetical protein